MRLVAIDPGLRHLGVAEFWDGILQRAFLVKSNVPHVRGPEAWRAFLGAPVPDEPIRLGQYLAASDVVVLELQQVYRTTPNASDLLQVNGVTGALAGATTESVIGYLPREWKGSTPKDIHHKRVLAKLSTREASGIPVMAKSLLHNCLDAVGLGLFHLGRM